jgi:hypothetical protein
MPYNELSGICTAFFGKFDSKSDSVDFMARNPDSDLAENFRSGTSLLTTV